jgi:molybdopterin-containing oxidoreductase family membrane subunit
MTTEARQASLRPFGKPSPLWWLTIMFLSMVVMGGIAAWIIQLKGGMGVAGYNDHAFWAIYIADVITFIGVSYGGAVVSAILRLTGATWRAPLTRLAEGTAVVTVLIGSALIIPHIGNPILLWELVARPNLSAPVFWDFVAVQTYTLASIVFFALPLVPDMAVLHKGHGKQLGRGRSTLYKHISKGWVGSPKQRRVLAGALGLISIMIIPLAVSVHSVLAWAFATTSRPWWHESIWAPQFVVAALYSGVALVILVVAGFRRGYKLQALINERHFVRLGFILATFAATYIYFTFADLLPGSYVADHSTASMFSRLLTGELAPWFWMFVIGGGVLPLLLIALPWTRNIKGMVFASILIVPMMWLKRMLMVTGPASYDTMTGAFGSYHFTWVPIAITLAATAAIPLLLMLLFRVVPLLSIDEIEEIDEAEEVEELKKTLLATPRTQPVHAGSDERLVGATGHREAAPTTGKSRRIAGATGILALVAILSIVGVGAAGPAKAAESKPAGAILITGVDAAGSVQLTARLFDEAGLPLPDAPVTFGFNTKQFGKIVHVVPLGSVNTDPAGVALLTLGADASHLYKPTTTGPQVFVATYEGGPKPITSSATINVTAGQSAYHPAPDKPLAGVGNIMVIALFSIVALIWLTLFTQIWRVRRVCRVRKTSVRTA